MRNLISQCLSHNNFHSAYDLIEKSFHVLYSWYKSFDVMVIRIPFPIHNYRFYRYPPDDCLTELPAEKNYNVQTNKDKALQNIKTFINNLNS